VEDRVIMKHFQAMKQVDQDFPYLKLGDEFLLLFGSIYGLAKVALVGQLHHDAKAFNILIKKGLIVLGNVG
jgi:hypothetical protein